ncbi:DUF2188 domain-containing protein [Archangium lipolyticum]|uniref:DUF2188 domain-containing protein n=1 Tax=Archangium lipolyticum TaxID=2970465 RepID=UPI00214A1FF8|nr:DUF2188 domain-containing protein [Archangium lipolyticum]
MTLAMRIEREQQQSHPAPRRRWVTVAADGSGWYVRLEGNHRVDRYPNVTQAIHRGRKLAHQHKPSGLVVQYLDGEEEELQYESATHP